MIEDWRRMHDFAVRKQLEARQRAERMQITNPYILSSITAVAGLLFIYIVFYVLTAVNAWLGTGLWTSLITAILIGAPLGVIAEWVRRRVGR